MYHGHKEEANITTASPTERRRYECTLLIYCLNRGLYFFVHLFRLKEYMNLVHTIYLCAQDIAGIILTSTIHLIVIRYN